MQYKIAKNIFSRKIRRLLIQVKPNRRYKDALFRFIFRDKEKLLSLYNALNNSSYTDSKELQIITKEDVIYMQMKEDVSFLIANTLNLYEHQSTWNPNMPIRGLIYLATRYEEMIRKQGLDIYGRKLVLLPTPRYVVFYNGEENHWERKELRLSEAFSVKDTQPAVEIIVTVLNINYSHNQELLIQCKPLQDYSYFVAKVKEYQKSGESFEDAMELAIDYCIEYGILADLLSENRAEVKKMLLTEYNPKKHIQNEKQISYEEGIEKGMEQERIQSIHILIDTLRDTGMSREEIAQTIKMKYHLDDEKVKLYMHP